MQTVMIFGTGYGTVPNVAHDLGPRGCRIQTIRATSWSHTILTRVVTA